MSVKYRIKVSPKESLNKSYLAILDKLHERGFPTEAHFADEGGFDIIYEIHDMSLDDETVRQLEKIPSVKVKKMLFEKITNWDPSVGRGYFNGEPSEPIHAILRIGKNVYVTSWVDNPGLVIGEEGPEFLIDREETYRIASVDESIGEASIKPVRKHVTLDLIEHEINKRKPWNCTSID
jgi:hypothetical protein